MWLLALVLRLYVTHRVLIPALRILKTLCRKLKLPEDFDYRQLARLTPGYVGADLMALCREAAMSAVNRVLLERQDKNQGLVPMAEERAESEGPQGAGLLPQGPERFQASADTVIQEMTDLSHVPQGDNQQLPLATETTFRVIYMTPMYTSCVFH